MTEAFESIGLEPLGRLRRDLRASAALMKPEEARYLVDLYYMIQENRIRSAHQERTSEEIEEPTDIVTWCAAAFLRMENEIKAALHVYAKGSPVGLWALSQHGIGPVITAGLLSHIDIERAPTVGHIWRFAGLDPTVRWEKKTKRPWNARLKTLCWKIGDSFVKFHNHEKCVYGKVYEARKAQEIERNVAGVFADQAAASLAEKRFKESATRTAYEAGRLPDGRIDLRARRYAVKLFLSHYHHVAFECRYGTPPPKPYIIEHGGHVHFVKPPNWPMVE